MYIFWDNSNIHISGLNSVMPIKEPTAIRELYRTNFKNLFELVRNNRTVDAAYLSGSIPPPNNDLWEHAKNLGIQLQLLNKASDGTEQESVDMSLQTMMLRNALDNPPCIMAVLTGDGAGKQLGEGFLSDLKRIARLNWKIEVYSWDITCNRYLKDFAIQNGTFIPLEDYYESITYLKRDRYNDTGLPIRASLPLS
jgi:hypothetical protein